MTARLRAMRHGDIAALATLETTCFGADAFSKRQLRYLVSRARACTIVALDGGSVVAYGCVLLPKVPRPARIYTLAVAPAARSAGIARRICRRLIRTARRRGYDRLRLEVSERNTSAAALYASLGFRRIATVPAYYADGSAAVRMQLELLRDRLSQR